LSKYQYPLILYPEISCADKSLLSMNCGSKTAPGAAGTVSVTVLAFLPLPTF